jgi:hypothetical protein
MHIENPTKYHKNFDLQISPQFNFEIWPYKFA